MLRLSGKCRDSVPPHAQTLNLCRDRRGASRGCALLCQVPREHTLLPLDSRFHGASEARSDVPSAVGVTPPWLESNAFKEAYTPDARAGECTASPAPSSGDGALVQPISPEDSPKQELCNSHSAPPVPSTVSLPSARA